MSGFTRTSVVNAALRILGVSQINLQTSESSPVNAMASAAFPGVLRFVLAEHWWSFAMRYAELAKLPTNPIFKYLYSYQIPTDCVRIFDIRDSCRFDAASICHEHVGGEIYANASPCYARYTSSDCESLAHDQFIEALVTRLAVEIAPSVSSGGISTKELEQRYLYKIELARCFDCNTQQQPDIPLGSGSNFIARRFTVGSPPERQ